MRFPPLSLRIVQTLPSSPLLPLHSSSRLMFLPSPSSPRPRFPSSPPSLSLVVFFSLASFSFFLECVCAFTHTRSLPLCVLPLSLRPTSRWRCAPSVCSFCLPNRTLENQTNKQKEENIYFPNSFSSAFALFYSQLLPSLCVCSAATNE